MKKWAVLVLGAALILGACGEESSGNEPAQQAEAETAAVVEEGGWIKHNNAKWSGEHNGVNINVDRVSIAPDIGSISGLPELDGQSAAVLVTTFENPTDQPLSVDSIDTKLITDDGYELEVSGYITDDFISELRPGTKQETKIGFILSEETDPQAIESVTAVFRVQQEGISYMYEDVEAQIQLK